MRAIDREVLARDATWTLDDGACKELTTTWSQWEKSYSGAGNAAGRAVVLREANAICGVCPITTECADLAQLIRYTGIAAGRAYVNGRPDTRPTAEDVRSA